MKPLKHQITKADWYSSRICRLCGKPYSKNCEQCDKPFGRRLEG